MLLLLDYRLGSKRPAFKSCSEFNPKIIKNVAYGLRSMFILYYIIDKWDRFSSYGTEGIKLHIIAKNMLENVGNVLANCAGNYATIMREYRQNICGKYA